MVDKLGIPSSPVYKELELIVGASKAGQVKMGLVESEKVLLKMVTDCGLTVADVDRENITESDGIDYPIQSFLHYSSLLIKEASMTKRKLCADRRHRY